MKSHYRTLIIVCAFCALLTSITSADSVVKRLYIDGVFIGEATSDAALSWPSTHLTLGAEGSSTGWRYNEYSGKIDEFAVYSGVLSDTRIAAHFNALPANYVTAVTADSPLLYLRFEDPNSANGNPAANSGSVAVNGTYVENVKLAAGHVGNAALFSDNGEEPDAAGDCIDVPDQSMALSLEDVTIELWMNSTDDPNNYPRLFQHNASWEAPSGYGLLYQPGQVGVVGGGEASFIDAVVSDGNWHHIVVTYDSTILPPTPYVDAVMADSPLAYYRFEDASSANGAVCADTSERAYKNGEYINLNAGTSGIADIALVPSMAGLGQAAQLRGDDGSGNGTCISIFDGWSAEYPTAIGYNADGAPRQTLSVEFWMYSGASANYPRILQHNDGGEEGFGIASADGQLTIMGGKTTWYPNAGNVFDSQWHHVVATYQPGTEPNSIVEGIYIDGVNAGSHTVATGSSLSLPTDFLTLGNNGSKYYVYNSYTGLLDEVAFYDTVLSAQRVWAHYSAASGIVKPYDVEVKADQPVLYLEFEDQGDPHDSSVNDYFVEYGASAAVQQAMGIGNAIYLNGATNSGYAAAWNQTTQYTGGNTDVGDQFSFTPGDITFEWWVKPASMAMYGMIFQQIAGNESKAPGIGNSGGTFRILTGATGWWYTGITTPIDNQWHHMVLTYDEGADGTAYSMRIQFYLDGVLRGTRLAGTTTTPSKLGPELNHLLIGGENDRGFVYNTMTGLVDEFAIYNGILSAERIATHHDAGVVALQAKDCAQVWIRGEGKAGDVNKDCQIDLNDFAEVAASWMACNDPALFGSDPDCGPTW